MGEIDTRISSEEKGMGVEERNSGKDGSSSSEDVVRWEKVMPKMVLRVLLVEADDSTRRIIAALLRKCSYRVAAVSDGLKAWETLKGRPNNIDLVLTELDLPSISGYALLTLVREDDVCKNIPVIMMSSSDSISLVLKCMLKGAADFLIKPVRKNELRNLWQHVWRRQTLTAGNEPEKGKKVVHDAEATSGNNEVSNHSHGCVASREKIKDNSDKESDARGFSSHKPGSASNLIKNEEFKMDRRSIMPKRSNGENLNGQGLEFANCHDPCNLSDLALPENQSCAEMMTQKGHTGTGFCRGDTGVSNETYEELVESYNGAIDFVSTFDSHREGPLVHTTPSDGKAKPVFPPELELSLRRFCPSIPLDQRNSEQDALNHSDYSPFSRYGGVKTLPSVSLVPASAHTQLKEHGNDSDGLLPKQNLEHTNVDIKGQVCVSNLRTEAALPAQELGLVHAQRVSADNKDPASAHRSPIIYYPQASLSQAQSPVGASRQEQSLLSGSTSINSNSGTLSIQQWCHRTDETMNNTVDEVPDDQDQMRPRELVRRSPAGDQSLCSGVDNAVSSSTNESDFCKKDGSSASDLTAEKLTAPANLSDGNPVSCDELKGVHSGNNSQREAALMKFRLKRKDRCYDKKVRYESRRRLAEQRPRVKGQFVRQVQTQPSVNNVSDCPSNS